MLKLYRSLLSAALVMASAVAVAQDAYPNKPVHLVVPFTPGGVTDLLARAIGEKLTTRLRQPVLVENRSGGGTVIASDYVAKAPADGYTIMLAASSLSTAPLIYPKVGYDPVRSFAAITLVAAVPHVLVVPANSPIKSVKELIAYAKEHPGKLSYGSVGTGTSNHLEGELLKNMANIFMVHIPYRGSAPALTDVMAGQVDVMFDAMASTGPFIKAGKLRPLAVSTSKRSPTMPEIPTVAEAGVPGYEAVPWLGLVAPAGTPQAIVDRLNKEVTTIMDEPEMKEKLRGWGLDPVGNSPAAFGAFIGSEVTKWGRVIKQANITAE